MANIRNQDSWVHSHNPDAATEKAKDLVRAAVARSAILTPLHGKVIPVNKMMKVSHASGPVTNAYMGDSLNKKD